MIGGLLSGFLQGFQAGDKMAASWSDEKYKKVRSKYMEAQMGLVNQKTKDLQDPEMRAAKLRQMNTASDFRGELGETYKDNRRRRALQDQGMTPGGTVPVEEGYTPPKMPDVGATPPGAQSAIPTAGPTMAQNDVPLEDPDDTIQDGQQFTGAKGGIVPRKRQAIKHYQEGGVVDDDDDEPDDEDDTMPDSATSTTGMGTPYGGYSAMAAHDAVLSAGNGLQQVAASQRTALNPSGGGRAVLSGKGAAGPMLTQQVYDKVDPKHEMSEGQRNMAAYSAVWQYYQGKGMPKEAQQAVTGLYQQNRINAGHYAALSAAALKAGHLDAAASYAAKAYGNIPDGRDLKITNENGRLMYSVTDEKTGKVQKKGIMTPQELGAAVTGFTPATFEAQIAAASGVRAGKGAKLQQADKPKDRDQSQKNLDEAYGTPKEGDTHADDIKSAAYQILNAPGQKILEKDAVSAAKGILYVDPKNPDTPQWKAEKVDIDGTPHAKVTFDGNKRSVIVPTEVMGSLLDQRAAAVAEAQAAGKKKEGENKRAGENADAAKGIITSAGEVGRATGKIPGSPSWLAERAGPAISGAIDKVGGAIKGADKAATEYVDSKLKSYAASKRPQAIATGDEE